MIGKEIAHYIITSQLGAGGMGEVYRARDSRLGREVAVKMLPEAFAQDPERIARFEREAKLLASLNHAGIAALYGLEESGGRHFLVMELVEGETLGERIKRGPIPVEEAGVILGTAPYMSPEQAKGFDADRRSDIFSFGAVLYEMLTGRQPFDGDTITEVIASVLARQPDLNILPTNINPRIEELIRRCLEKDRLVWGGGL